MHHKIRVEVGAHSSDFLRTILKLGGVADNNPKYMGSLYFQEIKHQMGMWLGGQSSQIYRFIRFHNEMGVGVGDQSSQMYEFLRFPGNASRNGGGSRSSIISNL